MSVHKFYISEHKTLINNLNKISDGLLKAKWYFLATIATIGLSYNYILEYVEKGFKIVNITEIKYHNNYVLMILAIFITCIIGNIIFWLINEYIISHGFLFRYIQGKAAQKEKLFCHPFFPKMDKFIRDPTTLNETMYNKDNKVLYMDFIIPDQFVPIFWASLFLIVINSIVGIAIIIINSSLNIIQMILCILLSALIVVIMLMLIYKIIYYCIYKSNKFITELCDYKIAVEINKKDPNFFSFPYEFEDFRKNKFTKGRSKYYKNIIRLIYRGGYYIISDFFFNSLIKSYEVGLCHKEEREKTIINITLDDISQWEKILLISILLGGLTLYNKRSI
ncbi:MAG: hypothetical protein ACYC6G_11370 [Desulfobaccales bacterium]